MPAHECVRRGEQRRRGRVVGGFDRPILLFSGHLERDEWKRLDTLGLLPVSKVDFAAVVRHVTAARRQYTNRTRASAREGDPGHAG